MSGEKTKTSRIVKPGDQPFMTEYDGIPAIHSVYRNGRLLYACGNTYPAQPGRGKKSVGRILLAAIERWDVRNIDEDFARCEGFDTVTAFWLTWCKMHDKQLDLRWNPYTNDYSTSLGVPLWRTIHAWQEIPQLLIQRPLERYDAWQLTFELVSP